MKQKYSATVHTLQPNRVPIQFIWDTQTLVNGVMFYYLEKDPVAEVPTTYIVTHARFINPITEEPSEHNMD